MAGDYANDHACMASDRANTAQMVNSIGVALAQVACSGWSWTTILTQKLGATPSTWPPARTELVEHWRHALRRRNVIHPQPFVLCRRAGPIDYAHRAALRAEKRGAGAT